MFETMTKFIFFVFLFFYGVSSANIPRASKFERRWAMLHPYSAMRIKKLSKKCFVIYNQTDIIMQLDSYSSGGKLDAFRHVFFMAAYAQKIKTKKLRQLGEAHEKGNYLQFLKSENEYGERPDSMACVMDLRNNELGFLIGKANRKLSLEKLKTLVVKEINQGNAFMIKRNSLGNYVDCDNREIDINAFSKQWFVPKCLVSSK